MSYSLVVPLPWEAWVDRVWPWHRRRCPVGADSDAVGRFGERVAESYLRSLGRRVLGRRFRCARGEVDLVCRDGDVLVFVEVKARAEVGKRRPVQTISWKQRRRIARAAEAWRRLLDQPELVHRFDVVEVELRPGHPPGCGVVVNAFDRGDDPP
jgi:putative endonuclease